MSVIHRFMPQIMLIAGVLVLLGSYFADLLGFGSPGFGTRQHLGMLAGLILIVNGLTIWAVRPRGGRDV